MPSRYAGLFWCATFVVLDAVQAVLFGALLQRMDSFLIGFIVFGVSSVGCLLAAPVLAPGHVSIALRNPATLASLNVTTACGWISYLGALQIIEPAAAFTIFSGAIPLTLIAAGALRWPDAEAAAGGMAIAGHALIALGVVMLSVFTLAGWSGFLRGGPLIGLAGVLLSILSGMMMAGMLLASYRLSRLGVGPSAVLGLRFPLYVAVALAGYLAGFDAKGAPAPVDLALAVAVGLGVLAFPIYAVQKAVSLTSSLTLGAATALIPLVVFILQIAEGRVAYSNATLAGLGVYFAGALLVAGGRFRVADPSRT